MTDRILLVEDDPELGAQIAATLRDDGFDPSWLRDGTRLAHVAIGDYALVILDLMLPGRSGMDLLADIRKRADIPVLILTARHDTRDKITALDRGADDYLTKPFWPDELLARVRARLRRPALERAGVLRVGPLEFDLHARVLRLDGQIVELTRVEWGVLAALARRPGMAVPRGRLAEELLDPDAEGGDRTLDVHVSRIRRKLGAAAPVLQTVWGIGYRLDPERR